MKRRAPPIKLLLFLLAGAIINVAVAWGWARLPESPIAGPLAFNSRADEQDLWDQFSGEFVDPAEVIVVSGSRDAGRKRINMRAIMTSHWATMPDVRDGSVYQGPGPHNPGDPIEIQQLADVSLLMCGWPMSSVYSAEFMAPGIRRSIGGWLVTDGSSPLPIRPILPGFAINTIFYAAVLWVLCAVPVKVRRWRRIKRGQCASCGYSLRGRGTSGGEKCPECGALLPQRGQGM